MQAGRVMAYKRKRTIGFDRLLIRQLPVTRCIFPPAELTLGKLLGTGDDGTKTFRAPTCLTKLRVALS